MFTQNVGSSVKLDREYIYILDQVFIYKQNAILK